MCNKFKVYLYAYSPEQVRVPIIIAGCSVTNREYHNQSGMEIITTSIREQYLEIETCFDWSAHHIVREIFTFYAFQEHSHCVNDLTASSVGSKSVLVCATCCY